MYVCMYVCISNVTEMLRGCNTLQLQTDKPVALDQHGITNTVLLNGKDKVVNCLFSKLLLCFQYENKKG